MFASEFEFGLAPGDARVPPINAKRDITTTWLPSRSFQTRSSTRGKNEKSQGGGQGDPTKGETDLIVTIHPRDEYGHCAGGGA